MNNITPQIIKDFSRKVNLEPYNRAYNIIQGVLERAIGNIKQRNPYISNYKLFVANEVFSGAEFYASSLDFFVVFDAVQIELNTTPKKKGKFLTSLKLFWSTFKNNFRIFRSKKKKVEAEIKKVQKKALDLDNYDVRMLYSDLSVEMAQYLYNKTEIIINQNSITIIGDEELGIQVNIYPVFGKENDKYSLYGTNTYSPVVIDFKNRFINIDDMNDLTNDMFITQIRIFNNLYWNIIRQKPNQIFIESLLFCCPIELYKLNTLQTTINIINYIKNSTMQNITSICDSSISVFKDLLNTTSYENAIKFINSLNIEQID